MLTTIEGGAASLLSQGPPADLTFADAAAAATSAAPGRYGKRARSNMLQLNIRAGLTTAEHDTNKQTHIH